MYTKNNCIIIEEMKGYSPGDKVTGFTDISGTNFVINNKDVVRIYECLKMRCERTGADFSKYCDSLFQGDSESV